MTLNDLLLFPQCRSCPEAGKSPIFCTGQLATLPSCWWEHTGKVWANTLVKLHRWMAFHDWCAENGLTGPNGEWLFELPQDWHWNGQEWTLIKAPYYEDVKIVMLARLRAATKDNPHLDDGETTFLIEDVLRGAEELTGDRSPLSKPDSNPQFPG